MFEAPNSSPGNVTPELPKSPRDQGEALKALQESETNRGKLEEAVITGEVQRSANKFLNNPKAVEKQIERTMGQQRLEQLKGVIARNTQEIDGPNGIRGKLGAFIESNSADKRLQKIMDALTAPVPTKDDEKVTGEARRYIDIDGKEPHYLYILKIDALRADQQYVALQMAPLKKQPPDPQYIQLKRLQDCLAAFETWDPLSVAGHRLRQKQSSGALDKGVGQMGRLGGIVVLSTMGLLTGVLAAANRTFSATPFFYLGLAALVGNPQIWRGMFTPKEQQELEKAMRVIGSDGFNLTCARRNIQGPKWKEVVDTIMTSKGEAKRAADAMEKAESDRTEKDKNVIEDFLSSVPKETRPTLEQMLRTNVGNDPGRPLELVGFIRTLLLATDEEPQRLIAEYVNKGAWSGSNIPNVKLPPRPPISRPSF